MKMAAVLLSISVMAFTPVPVAVAVAGDPAAQGSWQPYYKAEGGSVHAFFSEGIVVRDGDRVRVRSRALEAPEGENLRVTTILYDLDCRQRTFRMLDVVEEQAGERNICRNPSDDFPIRPAKHPHVEILRTMVCP
jgi:hypothetical protein